MGSVFGSPRPSDERVGGAYLGKQNQSNPTTVRKAQEVAEFLGWGKQGEWAWFSLCFGQGPRRIVPQGRPGFGEQGLLRESLHV